MRGWNYYFFFGRPPFPLASAPSTHSGGTFAANAAEMARMSTEAAMPIPNSYNAHPSKVRPPATQPVFLDDTGFLERDVGTALSDGLKTSCRNRY